MKNHSTNPGEDLQAIRDIMERSSKFLSLSGLSGVFAGFCALVGVAFAWFFILGAESAVIIRNYLVLDALAVLSCAILGAIYFSYRKARKAGQPFWSVSVRRLLVHLSIPLATGGMFALILVYHNQIDLVAAVMLIFYGLALVSAGKFTFGEIHYLGLTEIALGILAAIFINYGLLLWMIGFGLMHILYGAVMYYRYER